MTTLFTTRGPAPAAPPRPVNETRPTPPRHARLAPAQRHPTHPGRADADAHLDVRVAEEGDEGRGIDRPHHRRPRRPTPEAADVDPATVMVGCPAPRSGVHPGPAVIGIVHPGTRAVGGPAGRYSGRHPDRTVLPDLAPAAVAVEVARAVDAGWDVAGAFGLKQPIGARVVPVVPVVEGWCRE